MTNISASRKAGMENAVRYLKDLIKKSTSVQRSDQFLADANWLWVEVHTNLKNPYSGDSEDHIQEFDIGGFQRTVCPDCKEHKAVVPAQDIIEEMKEEVRLRVIKVEKSLASADGELLEGRKTKESEKDVDDKEVIVIGDSLIRHVDRIICRAYRFGNVRVKP
ncbi:uncharacterized protein LOC111087494 [Limulus polyphemus]|uniref:Uncharacterized protein LOC111087494 n=1 Tax=Limulus polyphemus TaxID=6850 RepID=A0ABM1T283_LIMPO|nr:uncharacterized protein LOC111087494 [Limulus polyphemus]